VVVKGEWAGEQSYGAQEGTWGRGQQRSWYQKLDLKTNVKAKKRVGKRVEIQITEVLDSG